MFDKLKQLNQLKNLQSEFKKETATLEKNGLKVTINGNFEVQEIILNSNLDVLEQQNILKSLLNEARESIQKTLAGKMMSSGISF